MKKGLKIFAIVLGVIMLFLIYYIGMIAKPNTVLNYNEIDTETDNMEFNMNAVIVKVENKLLYVVKTDDTDELITLAFTEDIGYEEYQEIEIYFDGIILESYPAQLGNVGKIEIIKDKSDVEIPEEILKFCYSSSDNVNVEILELTCNGIELNIIDSNNMEYNYSHNYKIYEKVKNENYPEEGYKIGETTENSTAGLSGTGLEYIWKEKDTISDILSKDTEIVQENDMQRKFDWTYLNGELESGEYEFVLGDDNSIGIKVQFKIDEDKNVSCDNVEFLY